MGASTWKEQGNGLYVFLIIFLPHSSPYLCSIMLGTAVADVQRTTYKVILHIHHEEGVSGAHNLRGGEKGEGK